MIQERKIDKLDLIKTYVKNSVKRIRIQVTDWETFLQSTYNEGLVFTMFSELLKLNNRKANTQLINRQNT